MRLRPEPTVAAVALVWGTIGVLVRWVDLPSVSVVWCRVLIGAAGLWAWHRWVSDGRPLGASTVAGGRRMPRSWHLPATGVLLAGHWVALFAAYRRAPIGTVLLIAYLAPVVVTALAPRLLGERVPVAVKCALALGVAGAALVVGPGATGLQASGLVLAGLASVSFAALILVGKPLAQQHGGIRVALVQQAVAALVLVPFAALAEWGTPRASWGWLVVLGLVHTAGGLGLYLSALARMPASSHGVLGFLEPLSAVVFAWALLGERPGLATVAGGVLILTAGAIVVWSGSSVGDTTPEVAGAVG